VVSQKDKTVITIAVARWKPKWHVLVLPEFPTNHVFKWYLPHYKNINILKNECTRIYFFSWFNSWHECILMELALLSKMTEVAFHCPLCVCVCVCV
jgi:hypothetical protein